MKYDELRELQGRAQGYICLFGAGVIGKTWAYDLLCAMGFHISFYCDNNKKENSIIKDRIKTISLETLYSLRENVLVFITVSEKYQYGVRQQLERNGIYKIVETGYYFLQTFIESLFKINDSKLNEKFKWLLDDGEYLKRQFLNRNVGYPLDLDNPRTFNEKLQWLKLHDRKPEYVRMVDKYEVKCYIADKVGNEYVIPTFGVYETFDEIDFTKLPQQFVLKCTHDSGSIVVCKDKDSFDRNEAKGILERCLKRNFYWASREWPYKNIKPRIIAEKYMVSESESELKDYKLMCFGGKVECSFICSNRRIEKSRALLVNFYDKNWNPLPFTRHYPKRMEEFEKPEMYNKLIELAEILAQDIKFIRVDFYIIDERVYLGELTLYPGAGMEEFSPAEWDLKLGEMINIEI